MVTLVGTESTLPDLIENLLLLEHDAIAAYDTTIERLDDHRLKTQVMEFRQDHERHIQELGTIATRIGANRPTGGDAKEMLTTGKVALASLMGDKAILHAMRTNEEDTVTAYDRARKHADVPSDIRPIMERGYADEVRHRAWMEDTAAAM
jgi:rubrerythrin